MNLFLGYLYIRHWYDNRKKWQILSVLLYVIEYAYIAIDYLENAL